MNNFSEKLIQHLISYKEKTLRVNKQGLYKKKEYEHILDYIDIEKNFLPSILNDVAKCLTDVKRHVYFDHLNSSQAACFNLFISLKLDTNLSNMVFKGLIPGFNELIDIKFEYSDPNDYLNERNGRNDNKRNIGTDADIAIFYNNLKGEKCICLLEHKLSEKEFTNCNAVKSKANKNKEKCNDFNQIWTDTANCYYESGKRYRYWELTKHPNTFFDFNILSDQNGVCPFEGSLQQLWRNMLMAQSIENDPRNPVEKAYFGVVYHKENEELFKLKGYPGFDRTDQAFSSILNRKDKFFIISIHEILENIRKVSDPLPLWVNEYEEKYINL